MIARDLHGPGRRVLLRAAVLLGQEPAGSGSPRGRRREIAYLLERAAERNEPSAGDPLFFETVIAPLYGDALFAPGAGVRRAAALADRFLGLPDDPELSVGPGRVES